MRERLGRRGEGATRTTRTKVKVTVGFCRVAATDRVASGFNRRSRNAAGSAVRAQRRPKALVLGSDGIALKKDGETTGMTRGLGRRKWLFSG